ncbi:hypothetical protein AB6D40_018765 [Vibrio cyclitrophicus]
MSKSTVISMARDPPLSNYVNALWGSSVLANPPDLTLLKTDQSFL